MRRLLSRYVTLAKQARRRARLAITRLISPRRESSACRRAFLATGLCVVFLGTSPVVFTQSPVSSFEPIGLQAKRGYFSQLAWEYIDMVNGNLLLTFTDLALPGNAGMDLRIVRTYNQQSNLSQPFGIWSFGIAGVPVRITHPDRPVGGEEGFPVYPTLVTADGSRKRQRVERFSAGSQFHVRP